MVTGRGLDRIRQRERRGDSEIQLFDVASSEITFVTGGDDPTWSPDGSTLAFSGEDASDNPLVFTVVPGSSPIEVTGGEEPSWTPDGSELAFVRLAE